MSVILEVAEATEAMLHERLVDFSTPQAELWAIVNEGDTPTITKVGAHADVYDLLDSAETTEVARVADCIAVLTCGWASPVCDDSDDDHSHLPPSQHPKRRRVRLVVVANPNGVASVLRFQDDPENPITDDGNATGSLNDAVRSVFSRARSFSN